MPLLALNTLLPQSMRLKYQVALGVLPIGLMFASFFPLFLFAPWLEAALGIPPNSPIENHPNGTLWIAIFLGAMLVLMLLGYALGWFANAAISRFVLGWPAAKVRAVYLLSEVPSQWLKQGASPSQDPTAESLAKWEAQRSMGLIRFVLARGTFAWGASMLFALYIAPALAKGQPFTLGGLLLNLSLWGVAGTAFGAAVWFISESNYRKQKGHR